MNKNSHLIPSVVAAYAGAVLLTIPGLQTLGCCLIVPGSAAGAMFFYKKLNPSIDPFSVKDAIQISLLTGFYVAVFRSLLDLVITYIFKSNEFTQALPEMEKMLFEMSPGEAFKDAVKLLRTMAAEIEAVGFSALYSIFSFIGNLIMDLIFALPGGLLARNFFNKQQNS